MATTHLISLNQYLNTTYTPDVDYVDGRIEERNIGETDHSKIVGQICSLLARHQEKWQVLSLISVRVHVTPTRIRVPDVCVVRENGADEPIVIEAPLLCIEVLSQNDSLEATRKRAQDFLDRGIQEVWIFDPQMRIAYVCSLGAMTAHSEGILSLKGTEVEVSIEQAFKPLKRKS